MALDSTPEIERLVEEIRTLGNYGNQSDVLAEALRLLKEQKARELSLAESTARVKSKRRKLVLAVWIIQLLSIVGATIACAIDVESIVATFPLIAINGLALALLARPLNSWAVLGYSLSAPAVSAVCAALIAGLGLRPDDAQLPVTILLILYAVPAIIAALVIFPTLVRWTHDSPAASLFPMQYSLKSLLLATTGLCVALPISRLIFTEIRHRDYIIFGLFCMVALSMTAISLWIYLSDRRRQTANTEELIANNDRGVAGTPQQPQAGKWGRIL